MDNRISPHTSTPAPLKSERELLHSQGDLASSGFETLEPRLLFDGDPTVLFVVGDPSLSTSDTAIEQRLNALQFDLTVIEDVDVNALSGNGFDLVVVSSTSSAATVGSSFRDTTAAVVTWEAFIFDDMGLTGTTAFVDYDYGDTGDELIIVGSGHAIAAGLTGRLDVSNQRYMAWGTPSAGATVIAHSVDDPAHASIFTYESGAAMVGLNAPARRVGMFLFDDTAETLTPTGEAFFDAAVLWATGQNIPSAEQPVQILALGDSITYSGGSRLSYRYYLWTQLLDAGINVDMLGTLNNVTGTPPDHLGQQFDADHEGHGGFRADQINAQLPTYLNSYTPDVVLIHLGTNDIVQGQSSASIAQDLRDTIGLLRQDNPDVTILLAQIIPTNTAEAANVPLLNALLPDIASDLSTANSAVSIVDMFTGFSVANHLHDTLHPNDAGEQLMADRFFDALSGFLGINQAPTVDAGADRSVTTNNRRLGLQGSATDDGLPNGSLALTWSVVSGPGSVSFDDATSGTTTATFGADGTYVLRLTADDGSLSDSDDVTITINLLPTNQAPNANAGADRTVATIGRVLSLQGSASDDGLPSGTLTLAWSVVSGPGSVSFDDAGDATTGATFSADGTYILRLTANDGALSDSDDVSITISDSSIPVNQPPVVDAGADRSVTTSNRRLGLQGSTSDDGLPGGSLTRTWSVISGPGSVAFDNINSPTTTVTFSADGTYVLRLTANDGELSASDDVTIAINDNANPVNQAPSVNAGADRSVTTSNRRLGLQGSASDDGLPGGSLTRTWSLISGPGSVSFDDINNPTTAVTFSADGTYVLRLTANDGELSTSDEVTIAINDNSNPTNQAPTVNAGGDRSVTTSNRRLGLQGSASDDGLPGGTLTRNWSVVSGPGSAIFDDASNPTTAVTFSADGTYVLRLTANDGELSTSDDVTIAINDNANPTNQAPTVNAGTDRSVTTSNRRLGLQGSASDDGLPSGSLTRTWSVVSGPGSVSFDDINNPTTAATFSADGTYVLRLTANDGELSTSDDVTIAINDNSNPVNQAPTVNAGVDRSVTTSNRRLGLQGSASDDGLPGGSLTRTWSLISGPGSASFDDASNPTTAVTFSADGTYVLRLTANDGELSTSDEVTIAINDNSNPVNQAPTVNAGADRSVTTSNRRLGLQGSASDDGLPGGSLTRTWAVVSGPGSVSFDNIGSPTTAVTFSADGTYVLRLTANDGELSTSDDVTLAINDNANPTNQPPVVNAGADRNVVTGNRRLGLQGSASDDGLPNGSLSQTWSVVSGPGSVSFDNINDPNTTVTFSTDGTYILRLTVSDGALTRFDEVSFGINI